MDNTTTAKPSGLPAAFRISDRTFFCLGILLTAAELYKQLFLYYIINRQNYDWWFFPFQLCSLPMYFCLLLPFLPSGRGKRALYTFMQDYNLLGGAAALVFPEGFRHIHWTLTLHGYLWHILLVIIGLLIYKAKYSDLSLKGFGDTIPVFALCCCIATGINLWAPGPGRADMFYISPYHPSTQYMFHSLALRFGILPIHLLYLLVILIGSALVHEGFAVCSKKAKITK